jgi:DUF1680 family protein
MRLSILFLTLIAMMNGMAQNSHLTKSTNDQFVPADISKVKVGGELGRRIGVTIENNLFQLDIDNDFLSSFQKKNDAGYIGLGKLIDGVVKMAAYTNDEKVIALKDHLISEVIKGQEADGYPGNMTSPNRMWKLWDIHEMGYIINGLITDYKLFADRHSLEAARKGADYLIKNWSSLPEDWETSTGVAKRIAITGLHRTMLSLYGVTRDDRYLEFCSNRLKLINQDPGIVIGRRKLIEGHIYGYMASCLAQLEMYRMIHDEKLLGPTRKAINFLTSGNGLSISGGAGQEEIWTDDQDGGGDLGETCATAYQLRVYDSLLRLNGDSRYGDIMERTIYNALFGAQSPQGRQIRYFTPLEGERHYHNGDTYCCPCNYRRVISELPLMVYYSTGNGVAINLYTPSNGIISIPNGRTISLRQETDYPNSGHVIITVDPSETSVFPLKLRIPSWCGNAILSVNGKPAEVTCKKGTFAVVERLWEKGDQVILELPMAWRLVSGRARQAGRAAVMRGPLLFCLDPSQNEALAKKTAAELGRIVIDLASIEPLPVKNSSVRPDGIACILRADNKPFSMGNSGNLNLTLTEFADPKGRCTYFRVPDLSETVPDELSDLWK